MALSHQKTVFVIYKSFTDTWIGPRYFSKLFKRKWQSKVFGEGQFFKPSFESIETRPIRRG